MATVEQGIDYTQFFEEESKRNARDREIADLRRNGGMSLAEIGERFGVSRQRIHQITEEQNVDAAMARRAYRTANREKSLELLEDSRDAILRLFVEGLTYKEIAEKVGVKTYRVNQTAGGFGPEDRLARESAMSKNRLSQHTETSHDLKEPNPEDPRTVWPKDRVLEVLAEYVAEKHNGRLPSIMAYDYDVLRNMDLPSSATVRNLFGGWVAARVQVDQMGSRD